MRRQKLGQSKKEAQGESSVVACSLYSLKKILIEKMSSHGKVSELLQPSFIVRALLTSQSKDRSCRSGHSLGDYPLTLNWKEMK